MMKDNDSLKVLEMRMSRSREEVETESLQGSEVFRAWVIITISTARVEQRQQQRDTPPMPIELLAVPVNERNQYVNS